LFRPSQLPKDSAQFFRSHDIAHVVFGLDTTLTDEALAEDDRVQLLTAKRRRKRLKLIPLRLQLL
jgi:hypothetical protein